MDPATLPPSALDRNEAVPRVLMLDRDPAENEGLNLTTPLHNVPTDQQAVEALDGTLSQAVEVAQEPQPQEPQPQEPQPQEQSPSS